MEIELTPAPTLVRNDSNKSELKFTNESYVSRKPSFFNWTVFFLPPLIILSSFLLQLLSLGIDNLTVNWHLGSDDVPSEYRYSFASFFYALFNPEPITLQSSLESTLNSYSFILGLLVTITGIVLNFASERTTSHVTNLFFQDKFILAYLGFVIIGNSFGMWVFLEVGVQHSPRFSPVIVMVFITIILAFLLPYLDYMFSFLETEKVVTSIVESALKGASQAILLRKTSIEEKQNGEFIKEIERHQIKITLSIEYLMDGAMSGLKKKSKNVTSEIADALSSLCTSYLSIKESTPSEWFEIPLWIRQSPDFLILKEDGIHDLVKTRSWVEWKILRQFQRLFTESLKWFTEMCYHICINTRLIAEAASQERQYAILDLTIKFFNTFLRIAITSSNIRVVYNTLFQYRILAEFLVDASKLKDGMEPKELASRALKIAKYMRYYAWIVHLNGQGFLVETVAEDLRMLTQTASESVGKGVTRARVVGLDITGAVYRSANEKILDVFLSLGDITSTEYEKWGVTKAQIILALHYIHKNRIGNSRKIFRHLDTPLSTQPTKEEIMAVENHRHLLISLKQELSYATPKDYWEVTERGANFAYLPIEYTKKLSHFFSWFGWYNDLQSFEQEYWNTPDGQKLKLQQELNNFDGEMCPVEVDEEKEKELEESDTE